MIFKKKDSDQKIIDGLKLLLSSNIVPEKNYFIARDLQRLKTGSKGEKDAAYYLDFFYGDSPRWAVIHDLRIEHNGKTAQIDHILINRIFDFYILESKSFRDKLRINTKGEFSAVYDNKVIGIESPLEQNERHIHLLNQFLRDNDILPKRLGLTIKPNFRNYVLISPKTTIKRPPHSSFDTSRIIKADTLKTVIEEYADNLPITEITRIATISNFSTIAHMAKAMVSHHKPNVIDLKKKYGFTDKHIADYIKKRSDKTGHTDTITRKHRPPCPWCHSEMVQRTAKTGNKFWGCPKYPQCRGTRSIT